jgi:hypothetical protein
VILAWGKISGPAYFLGNVVLLPEPYHDAEEQLGAAMMVNPTMLILAELHPDTVSLA